MEIIKNMNIFLKNGTKSCSNCEICFSLKQILCEKIPIIVCIGTDAVVGDSLGPLVGSMLKENLMGKTYVFGTVDCPITAKEVGLVAEFVKNAYPDTPILAIDAALGKKQEIGTIKVMKGPIKPGLGVDKDLAEIGTASIIGVVEEKEKGKRFLSSVRLSVVYMQAKAIANAINSYISSCKTYEENDLLKITKY